MKNTNAHRISAHFVATLPICEKCIAEPSVALARDATRFRDAENAYVNAVRVCSSCAALAPGQGIECTSLDCPVYFARKKSLHNATLSRELFQEAAHALKQYTPADLSW